MEKNSHLIKSNHWRTAPACMSSRRQRTPITHDRAIRTALLQCRLPQFPQVGRTTGHINRNQLSARHIHLGECPDQLTFKCASRVTHAQRTLRRLFFGCTFRGPTKHATLAGNDCASADGWRSAAGIADAMRRQIDTVVLRRTRLGLLRSCWQNQNAQTDACQNSH